MKNLITSAGLFLLILSGAAYGQSTTLSTNPKQGATTDSTGKSSRQGARKTTDGANNANKKSPAGASTTAAPNATSKPSAAALPAGAKQTTAGKSDATAGASKNAQAGNQKSDSKSTTKTAAPAVAAAPKKEPKLTGTGGAHPIVKNNQSQNPADLEVKSGSGSAERNTKNNTGKTGNYKNEQIKKDQPKP
ncbi:hypothetical protein ACFP1I_06030 [Dyadobacter subterraneus]|uniref:Colicin import membrane protein n=1 Tax=Dyadobacter subterraneus TaxID=2773304 RepID=A0ABR9WFW1_9BACT|nr:hypothetical protein [Dyadobacter subterraneus]MBE9464312.1 hypothetical protein [Dyadobacter subterraneus]